MKLPRLLIFIAFLTISMCSFSQKTAAFNSPYKNAFGVKLFTYPLLSYRHFNKSNKAVEALGYISLNDFNATILSEKFFNIEDAENLSWFIGWGGHYSLWSDKNTSNHSSGTAVGIDGIIGFDYKINNAPLTISVDFQPSLNLFAGNTPFEKGYGGIALRYVFNR